MVAATALVECWKQSGRACAGQEREGGGGRDLKPECKALPPKLSLTGREVCARKGGVCRVISIRRGFAKMGSGAVIQHSHS